MTFDATRGRVSRLDRRRVEIFSQWQMLNWTPVKHNHNTSVYEEEMTNRMLFASAIVAQLAGVQSARKATVEKCSVYTPTYILLYTFI